VEDKHAVLSSAMRLIKIGHMSGMGTLREILLGDVSKY